MAAILGGAVRALFILGGGILSVCTSNAQGKQELLGHFFRENFFLKSNKYAEARFGPIFKWFMWLMLVDTDLLMRIHNNINLWSDRELHEWRENILTSYTAVGVAGSVLSTVNIAALALDSISEINWTARATFAVSLMTGILSVVFGTRLQRKLYLMSESLLFRQWLSDGQVYSGFQNHDTSSYPLQSSIHAVRVLQLPVELLTMSAVTFIIGFILYTALMWKQHSDPGVNDYRNIMICILLVLVSLVSYYEISMAMKDIEDNGAYIIFNQRKKRKRNDESGQRPAVFTIRKRFKPWPGPGEIDDALESNENEFQKRLRALRQSRRPWIYVDDEPEDSTVKGLQQIYQAQENFISRMDMVSAQLGGIVERLQSQRYFIQMDTVTTRLEEIIDQLRPQRIPEQQPSTRTSPGEPAILETAQPLRVRSTIKQDPDPDDRSVGSFSDRGDEHSDPRAVVMRMIQYAKKGDEKGILRLLDKYPDLSVDSVDERSRTALMEAAAHGKIELVATLIGRRPDLSKIDQDGKTAKDLAKDNGYDDIVDLLGRKVTSD